MQREEGDLLWPRKSGWNPGIWMDERLVWEELEWIEGELIETEWKKTKKTWQDPTHGLFTVTHFAKDESHTRINQSTCFDSPSPPSLTSWSNQSPALCLHSLKRTKHTAPFERWIALAPGFANVNANCLESFHLEDSSLLLAFIREKREWNGPNESSLVIIPFWINQKWELVYFVFKLPWALLLQIYCVKGAISPDECFCWVKLMSSGVD